MDYKELLQLINKAEEKEKAAVKKSASKSSSNLSIVYLDDYDMIIDNRKGDRLVFAPTKGEYTLTTRENGTENISSFGSRGIPKQLAAFFMNESLPINNKVMDTFAMNLMEDCITLVCQPNLVNLMISGQFSLKSNACRKYLSNLRRTLLGWPVEPFESKVMDFFESHDSEYCWLCNNTSFITSKRWNYDALVLYIAFKKIFGNDIARYFATSYTKSSAEIKFQQVYNYNPEIHLSTLSKSTDIKRVIDYICFELYIQGIKCVNADLVFKYMKKAFEYNELGFQKMSIFSEHFASDMDNLLNYYSYYNAPGGSKSFEAGDYSAVLNGSRDYMSEYMLSMGIPSNSLAIYNKAGKLIAFSCMNYNHNNSFSYIATFDGSSPTKEMFKMAEEANEYLHDLNPVV